MSEKLEGCTCGHPAEAHCDAGCMVRVVANQKDPYCPCLVRTASVDFDIDLVNKLSADKESENVEPKGFLTSQWCKVDVTGPPLMPSTIGAWTQYILDWCKRKGYSDSPVILESGITVMHLAIKAASEQLEQGKQPLEVTMGTVRLRDTDIPVRPEGFPVALASVAIELMHICGHLGINLEEMIALEMQWRETQ